MKERIKATGEIVEMSEDISYVNAKYFEKSYYLDELEWIDVKKDAIPDYWTRLEHTYAGMAMQGLSKKYFKEYRDYCAGFGDMDEDEAKGAMKDFANAMADVCYYFAHALVEKMKEERK